jgi:hypothetical protein
MASRRSGSPVFLILLLVAGNVGLVLLSYWLWQTNERANQQIAQTTAERDEAKKAHGTAVSQLGALRQRINHETNVGFAEALEAIENDLREFGTGTPNETYADVVRRLQNLVETHRAELKQLIADKDRLQGDFETSRSTQQKVVDVAEADSQVARKELVQEEAEMGRKLAAKDEEILRALDKANTLASRMDQEKRDKEKIREELLGQVNKLRTILIEARAPHTPSALAKQKPDGRVVKSSAATKTAWLNIGSRQGVETQLTFSVQPAGFTGNPFTKPKAKLEVVKVNGPDMCEARIVESVLTNPVIEGDEIYNPAWNPGKVMRFALAGLLDIDGDGTDDRAKVRQLITIAGAKIDAEVFPDGTERGEVTVETNFFVRGIRPDPDRAGVVGMKVLSSMAKMERTALDYGATVIDLGKFLDLMGYTPVNRPQTSSDSRATPGSLSTSAKSSFEDTRSSAEK